MNRLGKGLASRWFNFSQKNTFFKFSKAAVSSNIEVMKEFLNLILNQDDTIYLIVSTLTRRKLLRSVIRRHYDESGPFSHWRVENYSMGKRIFFHTDSRELFGNLKLLRCCHLVASLMMGHRRKSRCRPSKIF